MKSMKKLEVAGTRAIAKIPFAYSAARALIGVADTYQVNRIARNRTPVFLVYQQGRVGSTAAYNALARSDLDLPLFHLHSLSKARTEKLMEHTMAKRNRVNRNGLLSLKLGPVFDALTPTDDPAEKWKVLAIFRDPVSIMLSLRAMKYSGGENGPDPEAGSEETRQQLLAEMKASFEADDPSKWEVVRWFEDVLPEELGIDPFSDAFDHDKGYLIVENNKLRFAALKFEQMNDVFNDCIEELLGKKVGNLGIAHENIHRNKSFDQAHQVLKSELKLSGEFLDRLYSTRLMQHYYSDEERAAFTQRWIV